MGGGYQGQQGWTQSWVRQRQDCSAACRAPASAACSGQSTDCVSKEPNVGDLDRAEGKRQCSPHVQPESNPAATGEGKGEGKELSQDSQGYCGDEWLFSWLVAGETKTDRAGTYPISIMYCSFFAMLRIFRNFHWRNIFPLFELLQVATGGGPFLREEGYVAGSQTEASWLFVSDSGLDQLIRWDKFRAAHQIYCHNRPTPPLRFK